MSRKIKDLTGQKFGRLTALETAGKDKSGNYLWHCKCECGNECVVRECNLIRGITKSCGCFNTEMRSATHATHGLTHNPIHNIWFAIKARCFNTKNKEYKNYGARGITMYEPWIHDFKAFYDYVSKLEHFGEKGYSLDRINNDKNYEPDNLRWATQTEQQRNRRSNIVVEYNGEQMTLIEASELSGISYSTLQQRHKVGDRAINSFVR